MSEHPMINVRQGCPICLVPWGNQVDSGDKVCPNFESCRMKAVYDTPIDYMLKCVSDNCVIWWSKLGVCDWSKGRYAGNASIFHPLPAGIPYDITEQRLQLLLNFL